MFLVSALQQMATGLRCYECSDCAYPTNLVTVQSGYSCTVNNNRFLFIACISEIFVLSRCRKQPR
jgi:hypothetical protein